jgi:hypothetical protein
MKSFVARTGAEAAMNRLYNIPSHFKLAASGGSQKT